MTDYLLIFAGGGLGSMSRFALGSWANKSLGEHFPYATLSANFVSSVILGALIAYLLVHPGHTNLKLLIGVGFCGGFSTFSTFTLENFELLNSGQSITALIYTVFSVVICLGGLWTGYFMSRVL